MKIIESRNQREGKYKGFLYGKHRRHGFWGAMCKISTIRGTHAGWSPSEAQKKSVPIGE